jgi:hypothetical protein
MDLGELGFWLAVGIVVAAAITAHGLKEREKERQKQETLRALLTADGKSTSEVLAYMREKDAAEAIRAHAAWVASGGNMTGRAVAAIVAAFVVGILSFLGGVIAFSKADEQTESWQVAVGLLLGIWTAGFLLAFLIYFLVRGKKNVPPPGA